jgi:hypothetical protein
MWARKLKFKLNFKVGGKSLEGNLCGPKSMIYHHFVGRSRRQDTWQVEWREGPGLRPPHEQAGAAPWRQPLWASTPRSGPSY